MPLEPCQRALLHQAAALELEIEAARTAGDKHRTAALKVERDKAIDALTLAFGEGGTQMPLPLSYYVRTLPKPENIELRAAFVVAIAVFVLFLSLIAMLPA